MNTALDDDDAEFQADLRQRAIDHRASMAWNQVHVWFEENPDANPHRTDIEVIVKERR